MSSENKKPGGAAKINQTPSITVSNDSSRRVSYMGRSKSVFKSKRPAPSSILEKQIVFSDIRVFNEAGEDVTPRPLLQQDQSIRKNQLIMTDGSQAATPSDLSQGSIYQFATIGGGATTAGPFTRSVFSASISGRSTDMFSDDFADSVDMTWNDKVEYKRDETAETVTQTDLDRPVELILTETETIWMLDLPAISIMNESPEALIVTERNRRYEELTKSKPGNDRYTEKGMNTFNDPPKNKHVQTIKITHDEAGVNASRWDMHDAYNLNNTNDAGATKAGGTDDEMIIVPGAEVEVQATEVDSKVNEELKEVETLDVRSTGMQTPLPVRSVHSADAGGRNTGMSSGTTFGDSIFGGKDSVISELKKANLIEEEERILKSEDFRRHLVVMERVINLNTYQPKVASYRNFPNLTEENERLAPTPDPEKRKASPKPSQKMETMSDLGPNVERLWSYQCPLTKGHNVSCMAWNKVNPDLVAVGYGQFEYTKQKSGLVCCWSIKNPEFPERVYTTEAGVLSVDFSQSHPNLLAVGMYNGTISIYNVAISNKDPVLDSLDAPGKHTGPVWQLRWIEKERGTNEERTEVLVSISADGRVTQWAIRKGFESYDLIKLKRLTTKQVQGKQKKNEAYISKYAGGLCFNFSAKDSNIYLAGTEDGYIHKCSCSYNEQYLDSYSGHTGPVYCVHSSPFDNNVFLSSSADWSIRLWHQERLQPVLNLFSSTKAVHSFSWSPNNSTIFACVNEGALEVWDLSQNTLDPILQNTPSTADVKLSSISFARNADCFLVGDSEGQVTVYQLRGLPPPHLNQMEALQQVISSCLASQLKN